VADALVSGSRGVTVGRRVPARAAPDTGRPGMASRVPGCIPAERESESLRLVLCNGDVLAVRVRKWTLRKLFRVLILNDLTDPLEPKQQGQPNRGDRRVNAKRRVFISFDFDHDEDVKIMLVGQATLPDSPFDFIDASVKEPLSGNWKEKVRRRMQAVDVVIVLCGEHTHRATGVAAELEIAQEQRLEYFHLAAYADKYCSKPASSRDTDKVYKWTWDGLKALLSGAR